MKRLALALGALAAFVALLAYLSLGSRRHGVTACVTYQHDRACGTAWGPTRAAALRVAVDGACGALTHSVGELVACRSRHPDSVNWRSEAPSSSPSPATP